MRKCVLLACMSLVLLASRLPAQECITSECHVDFRDLKVLHAPVEDDCLTCHEQTGDHEFSAIDRAGHCLECHDDQKSGSVVHQAMDARGCQDCHDPHGGSDRSFIKTERMDELCFQCHDQAPFLKKVVHGPMATGNCGMCHNTHSENNPSLLKSGKEMICIRCHTDKDYSGGDFHQHTPLAEGCDGCHDSHSSDNPFQLITPVENLCETCHDDLSAKAGQAKFKHAIVTQGKKCANCHDAHGSLFASNLKTDPLSLCLDCHNKPIIGTDGKDYNIYKIVSENPEKHGPIGDGNCTGCHDPHGSGSYKILISEFPEQFYTGFQEEKYNLCFECHDRTLVRDEKTSTLTNFRDGDVNLHYLHVNREKGRTCRACHEIHAGDLPNHVREEAPFGEWDIPIGFVKSETGGTCAPGCHKAYSYNRQPGQSER